MEPAGPAAGFAGVPALVTGGAGFIGSHLVAALVAAGARVRVLDDLSTGCRENLAAVADRIELRVGDLRDPAACRLACDGVRLVFHQAAVASVPASMERPAATVAVNVTGTANLLEACRDAGVRRVVYASSSAVYGDSAHELKREGEEGVPLSPYALSKWMDEELASQFGRLFGLECIGLRYFNVYGPRQDPAGPYAAVVPRFATALLAGQSPELHGDGLQSRDFVFVGDAVAANLAAALAPAGACGTAYNVASGDATTLLDLLAALQALTGSRRDAIRRPPRPGDVRHSRADVTRARAALGFAATVTLAEGLRRSLDDFVGLVSRASAPPAPPTDRS